LVETQTASTTQGEPRRKGAAVLYSTNPKKGRIMFTRAPTIEIDELSSILSFLLTTLAAIEMFADSVSSMCLKWTSAPGA
jgi:hypothetical protein